MKEFSKFMLVTITCMALAGCKTPEKIGDDADVTDPEVVEPETPEEERLVSQAVAGLWVGTTTSSTGRVASISGVITENKRIKLLESGVGTQFSGSVISTVEGQATAELSVFDSIGDGAKKNADISLVLETVVEEVSISGAYSSAADNGKFLLSYNPEYVRPSSIAIVSGAWSNREESINIDTNNGFNGQGANGCSYTGSIGIINPSFNAYNLNVEVTGCTDTTLSGDYFGVAWLGDLISQNDTLKYSIVKSDGTASLSSQLTLTVVGETPSVAGIWRGTITSSSGKVTSIATGIIAENGSMQLTTSDGDVISGVLGVDAGTDVSATAKFYKADRSANFSMAFSGVIVENSLLTGTYTNADPSDTAGEFSLTYDEVYEQVSKQSLVAGSWGEEFENILLNSIGSLSGTNTDSDCTLAGSIGMLSPTFNAYNVNISTNNCSETALNGDYSGLATLSDGSGDGVLDTLTYVVNNDAGYLTKIFTKASSLASISGIWRGTFTNNEGKSTFYKGLISEDNEIKFLADTESFPFDQGSDIISGTAIVHTKNSMAATLKEIPANNNPDKVLTVELSGVVTEKDTLSGFFKKHDAATDLVEFGSFSLKYDDVYTIPEVNFFVINDTEWDIIKFNNEGVNFYNLYLNLSRSFVLNSDRTIIVESEPEISVVSGPIETDVSAEFTVAPDATREVITIISDVDTTGSQADVVTVSSITTTERVTENIYRTLKSVDGNDIFRTETVTETSITTTTTTHHVDSNNCRYLGNYDVVDPRVNMWNLYMVVSGCNDLQVRNSDGDDLGITYNLDGIYTGLATLEEQFSVSGHPHDHFNFMTFGMVDTTGTKTINNRVTLQFFGN